MTMGSSEAAREQPVAAGLSGCPAWDMSRACPLLDIRMQILV